MRRRRVTLGRRQTTKMGDIETDHAPAIDGSPTAAMAAAAFVLPPGVAIRALRPPDDYPDMHLVANAVRASMGDSFTTTVEQMADYYDSPDRFVSGRDVVVVELDGRIVGYGRTGFEEEVGGLHVYEVVPFLDPALDPQPLYPLLLAILERHARDLAAADPARDKTLQTFGGDAAPRLEELVVAAGFTPARHGYEMVRPHLDDLPDAPLPDGLEIRPALPEQRRQIWDAGVEAYRDAWGATEPTEGDYERWLTDRNGSDLTLWQIAWDGDEVAGQVRAYIDHEENARFGRLRGYCENILVGRRWRRRGLATALIAASFPALRARGMEEAALGVDTENVSGALRVYERCGFRPVSRSTLFRKPLG
jgi:mycothiol synthase